MKVSAVLIFYCLTLPSNDSESKLNYYFSNYLATASETVSPPIMGYTPPSSSILETILTGNRVISGMYSILNLSLIFDSSKSSHYRPSTVFLSEKFIEE